MEVPANLQIGCRIQATTKDDVKIGKVAFVGLTSFAPGKWVGVVLDDDSGKNNGEVQGKKYFSCPDNQGIFVRPNQVVVLEELEGSDPISLAEPATPKSKPSGLKRPTSIATPGSGVKLPGTSGLRMPSASGTKGSSSSLSGGGSNLVASGGKGSTTNLSSSGFRGSSQNIASETKRSSRASSSKLKATSDRRSESPLPQPAVDEMSSVTAPAAASSETASFSQGTSLTVDLEKIKGLENEVTDLTEKLDTIKVKRAEDRNKLKEAEKIKIQHEQLKEYKTRSQETHKDLQQQLMGAKKEAKEVQEQYDNYKDEMAELQETIEMSALDKEMAEERAESLQVELDSLRENNEELLASVELMKSELQHGGGATGAGGVSSYQLKQLEQQNEKLKEALVKMRDLSNSDKAESAALKKQNEKMTSEVTHLKKDRETRIEEIEILNAELLDLKDQVDASLGAEDMVEKLTDQNLALEEKVATLEEEKTDLETINEMNEELQENAREVELDMREQLDMSKSKISQLEQSTHASQLQMADLQSTIGKYRELVQNLQYENAALNQQSVTGDGSKSAIINTVDSIEMKTKLSESKIQSKVIEMELLQLDLTYVRSQLDMTGKFLPEAFYQHGQDGDGIQVVLLFPNLVQKLRLLSSQVRSKFTMLPTVSKEDVVGSQSSEQASYGAYIQCFISQLVMQFNKLNQVLMEGDIDTYKVFCGLVTEFKAYSKPITQYLDLLQKDQLYESVSTEPLSKSLRYFQEYCDTQLETYPYDPCSLLRDQSQVLVCVSELLTLDLKRLEIITETGPSKDMVTIKKMTENAAELLQTVKRLKHCLPAPSSDLQVQMSAEMLERLKSSIASLINAMHVIHSAATQADRALHLQPEVDFLPSHQINQYLVTASELLEDSSLDLYEALLSSVTNPIERIKVLVAQLEGGSLDLPAAKKEKKENVLENRAEVFRREGANGGNTKAKLIAKEELNNQLKLELRKKQEEVDEFRVRAGMADKKVASASREKEDQILKLQRKLEESKVQLNKKEKEFEQTMDALQSDIDSLENEKGTLQTKLNNMTKKQMYDSLTKGASGIGSAVAHGMVAGGLDSPHLLEQIRSLRSTVNFLKEENQTFRSKQMKERLAQVKALTPLGIRQNITDDKTKQANLIKHHQGELKQRLNRLHQKVCAMAGNRQVSNVKVSPFSLLGSEEFKNADKLLSLGTELYNLKQNTLAFLAAAPKTGVQTNIQNFPKPLSQQLKKENYIGRIKVPTPERSEIWRLSVNRAELESLLHLIA